MKAKDVGTEARRHEGQTSHQSGPGAALTVRPAGAGDATPLVFFFDTVLRKDYFLRRGQLIDMLRSPYHQVYVAEIDRILVGVAITTRRTRLVNVLVHPSYRSLGIGKALIDASGVSEVRAKLDMSTGDPRPFYSRLGFQAGPRTGKRNNIELMCLSADDTNKARSASEGCSDGVGGAANPTPTRQQHKTDRKRQAS